MKNIFYAFMAGAAMLLASCTKEQPGGTAAEAVAGQWYVVADAAYDDPEVEVIEDCFGLGRFLILTYNSPANKSDEFIIDDCGNFWEFKVKVPCNTGNLTFSCESAQNMVPGYEELEVTITDGKIVPGGAITPSGATADYIEFYVIFSDDDNIPEKYDKLKISGYRYTGLVNDD